ncbi:MAG: lipid-A-disaccharide synthase [Lentisphaeria bacterium]|nr:lipid-A-disaccharide synthase [Lentisphaeria bacterium]
MRKIWIMAGEASGDMYGAALAEDLRKRGAAAGVDVEVGGMGGPAMAAAGVKRTVDSTELGVVGFVEILKHIFTFIGIFRKLVRTVKEERPDTVILIDYPTFNMLFGRQVKKLGIPVIWYVSPHVWVWGKRRIPKLAKLCRKMLVIFPFEPEVYAKSGLDTEFVGHPLLDMVDARRDVSIVRDPNLMVLLPGSRSMEIKYLMRSMLETVLTLSARQPHLRYVVSAPREKVARQCADIIADFRQKNPALPEIAIETGKTAYYQQAAGSGLAASGTVTVESAIAGLPLVVIYRASWLTMIIASMLVKLYRNSFVMPNIIANKKVYEEFLQHQVHAGNLVPAMERILPGGSEHDRVVRDMQLVRELLGDDGSARRSASSRAADAVWKTLPEK